MLLRLFLLLLCGLPVPLLAAPWAPPGDARLRSALDWLADRACLAAPITSWPVMWEDVQLAAHAPAGCASSSAWRYARFERDRAARDVTGRLTLMGANEAPDIQGFASHPREKSALQVTLETHNRHLALGLAPAFVPDPYGLDRHHLSNRWRWDGSYLAASVGNWTLGIRAVDQWWGPGWRSSLILGSNSRPVPALFLSRRQALPADWFLLKWLGAWRFSAFAGQLEHDRVVPDAKLLGMRLVIKPASWLELGASRTTQWGGEGRPENWNSFKDMLFGSDNYYSDFQQEPGNQLGGVDLRIGLPLGVTSTVSVYGQLIGEDEAGNLPSRTVSQLGLSIAGSWLPGRQQLLLEYTDTGVDRWSGDYSPNVAYEHHIYRNGYRYFGRSLGSGWDNDSQVTSLGWWQFFTNGNAFGITIDHAELNKDGTLSASSAWAPVPVMALPRAENLTFYRLDWRQPLWQGRLSLSATWTSQPLVTLTSIRDRTIITASWEYRFEI